MVIEVGGVAVTVAVAVVAAKKCSHRQQHYKGQNTRQNQKKQKKQKKQKSGKLVAVFFLMVFGGFSMFLYDFQLCLMIFDCFSWF